MSARLQRTLAFQALHQRDGFCIGKPVVGFKAQATTSARLPPRNVRRAPVRR